jgi:hypothetical protein
MTEYALIFITVVIAVSALYNTAGALVLSIMDSVIPLF